MTSIQESPAAAARVVRPASARREIIVFLTTVAALMTASTIIGLSQHVDVSHIEDASPLGQSVMYGQAFFPLVAAVLARLVATGTLRRPDWGFRRTSWRSIGIAWAYLLGTTLLGAGLLWAAGLAGFAGDGIGAMLPLGLTVLVLPYLVLAIGEDVGWRGLLVARLATIAGPRTVVLISSLAWAVFHWPLMIFLGGTPAGVPVWWSVTVFTGFTLGLGAVLANMQLRWGLWPGVVAHAVGNATMYHVLEPLTREKSLTGWFSGETGLIPAIVAVLGALLWWRFAPLARTPEGGTAAATRRR
ncbi:CPBP family intramembrane glutamic endopeptidase [Dactylosporangium sp. CA-139066]|uniref:CPBP family intramembrane glutamic endopeptidase n=1 Tax=Dactylosporangium sp. CA-139066 TaxID=3239930 RepID=UPI003D8AA230